MINRRTIKTVFFLMIFGYLILPTISFAQAAPTCPEGKYCSLTTIPGVFDPGTPADPVKVIKNIYGISIGIAAILAIGMIIYAGIEYATVESITGKAGAKEKWQGALWGLLLLLAAYIILRTINIDLVRVHLDLSKNGTSQTR